MDPHSLNLDTQSPLKSKSPIGTPRRVLGDIQNSPLAKQLKQSPLIERSLADISLHTKLSPLTSKRTSTTKISRVFEERSRFRMSNKENHLPQEQEVFGKLDLDDNTRDSVLDDAGFSSPVGSRLKRSRTVSNWTLAKITATPSLGTPTKHMEESSRDSGYSNSAKKMEFLEEQSIDFSEIMASTSFSSKETIKTELSFVPENDGLDMETDFETLHDLEQELELDNFDECSKYEIISTDSPNIISRGRSSTKINSKNFVFGAPISEAETSTSFNKPNITATRMLNFDEEDSFEFTSPQPKSQILRKKSLKFNESPLKVTPLTRDRSDSSIGSNSTPKSKSIYPSSSTTSMESGFISEIEDTMLDLDEASNSPKLPDFATLLSGQIKNPLFKEDTKRPTFHRSVSCNPEPSKVKTSLFPTMAKSPGEKRVFKNVFEEEDGNAKRRKNSCDILVGRKDRPVLQRAYSENAASIMSALARSASNPDLIGDFSLPFALPLTSGHHTDLKSISCDTLAHLMKGDFNESVQEFQVIDCRYPYEYLGGHISGSQNLYTTDHVLTLMSRPGDTLSPDSNKRRILVFHCEFSQERGPKLSRFLRSLDRAKNKENYPSLKYPEIYLLHEGYKRFHQSYPELCEPNGYTSMLDPNHKQDLQLFRSHSESLSMKKSFSMDEKKGLQRQKSRSRLLL